MTHKSDGYDVDMYSRMAWDNAMHDVRSEWTPTQYAGNRLEPNALNWLRHEQWGNGHSAKLFYNEVPNPTWFRHGGNLENVDKNVHSFTFGDTDTENTLGFDTSTPEGRKEFA